MDSGISYVGASQQPLSGKVTRKPIAVRRTIQFGQAFFCSKLVVGLDAAKTALMEQQLSVKVVLAIERYGGYSCEAVVSGLLYLLFAGLARGPHMIDSKRRGLSSDDQFDCSFACNQARDSKFHFALRRHT